MYEMAAHRPAFKAFVRFHIVLVLHFVSCVLRLYFVSIVPGSRNWSLECVNTI